jgi:hypothetical protein
MQPSRRNVVLQYDAWGFIPSFLNEHDPLSAREQFKKNYIGGWNPFPGFKFDKEARTLAYPGDPIMHMIDEMPFRDETIMLFPHSWVVVMQKDGTWEASRMD